MTILTPKPRLQGVTVFLSASIPTPARSSQFRRIPEAATQIEGAVISIARAIFMEGGSLVFGGHPSISPLIAQVVGHYFQPAPAERDWRFDGERENEVPWRNPSVVIYQSEIWQDHWAESSQRLAQQPLVSLRWTSASPGERIDPEQKDMPQGSASLELMRRAMINESEPAAMIAIGGMEGVLDEAALFSELRPRKPIFALATTGGAASILADNPGDMKVQVIDREADELVKAFWREHREEEMERPFYTPYAFVAQQVVSILAGAGGQASQAR